MMFTKYQLTTRTNKWTQVLSFVKLLSVKAGTQIYTAVMIGLMTTDELNDKVFKGSVRGLST